MALSSPCDACPDPGACCRSFVLNRPFDMSASREDVQAWVDEMGLPFTPWAPVWTGGGRWSFSCLWLEGGRCAHYEERPEACRLCEPREDGLCVLTP